MHPALRDKTNRKVASTPIKMKASVNEKEAVVSYLREVTNRTKDYDLKYDVCKCIEILEGKENQEYQELKEILEEALAEKEQLFREKVELAVELDYLKGNIDKYEKIEESE